MQLSPEAKAGVTVLLSIVLFATLAMAVGRLDFNRGEVFEITLTYNTVDGLREGAPVRYAGVNVGNVAAIQLVTEGVMVKIHLDRELLIPLDSSFTIATAGLLGDKYVEIKPGKAQQLLDTSIPIAGDDPVVIDSLISEVELALRNLNQAVVNITEIAASPQLQADINEAGKIIKETASGLKTAVDQVSYVAMNIQNVVEDVETLSKQFPELNLKSTFDDLDKFSRELANLNLTEPVDEIHTFVAQLNSIPITELVGDVQRITQGLSKFDYETIEKDLTQFTGMLASIQIEPLVDEIMVVTEQIKSLEIDERGKEIAQFTSQLGEIPLLDISTDLQQVAMNLKQIPFEQIADNVYEVSVELTQLPLTEIVGDLQIVMNELSNVGWQNISDQIGSFTQELAAVDLQSMVADVTTDLNTFSQNLANMEIDKLLAGVTMVIEDLEDITKVVEPESVSQIVDNLEGISHNIHIASHEINNMVGQLNNDIVAFSQESFTALTDINKIVTGVEQTIANVNLFVDDLVAEGDTAANLKSTLANIQDGTTELVELLELVTFSLASETGPITQLQSTMASINKLNEDIQSIRSIGENVEVKSTWGAHLTMGEGQKIPRFMADIEFEFWPRDSNSFILVGMRDILGDEGNDLQLQYGYRTGFLTQRYGIIDTSLGIGLDSRIGDQWELTAEATNLTTPNMKLSLDANYKWTPDWIVSLGWHDIFSSKPVGFDGLRLGIERKF